MTRLDLVLERIRELPQERQDAIAIDLEIILEDEERGPLLTDEQWADLRRRSEADQGPSVSHEEIEAEFLPPPAR